MQGAVGCEELINGFCDIPNHIFFLSSRCFKSYRKLKKWIANGWIFPSYYPSGIHEKLNGVAPLITDPCLSRGNHPEKKAASFLTLHYGTRGNRLDAMTDLEKKIIFMKESG